MQLALRMVAGCEQPSAAAAGGLERGGGSELSGEPSVVWRLHSISVRRQVCAACCSRGVFRLISRSIRIVKSYMDTF